MEQSPNAGKSLEYLRERARRMALRYAEVSPYRLNPDASAWEGIVRAIGLQAHTFGWPYCPCQKRSGDPAEDRKFICPCYRHKQDIAETGHCICGLFVSEDYVPSTMEAPPLAHEISPGAWPPVSVYVTHWCLDSMRTVRFLKRHGIPFTLIDIEQDSVGADWVKRQNHGYLSTPTLNVGGRVLTEPSDEDLAKVLGLPPHA